MDLMFYIVFFSSVLYIFTFEKNTHRQVVANELTVLPLINLEVGIQMFINKIVYVLQDLPLHIKLLYNNRGLGFTKKKKLKRYFLSMYKINCNIVNCFSCKL